ncbi:MAG: hypothetical protein ASARMPRED_000694 [Alectoria sarmentosa]|nr:MAG: hypothetical protein ASARMPRED_000694 [Alectoria sarmentosa]
MDPLSITASAIAIIQLTTDLISGARSYYKSVKNSPKEIAELVHELESFDVLLKSLRDTSQREDERHKQQMDQLVCNVGPEQKASRLPMIQKTMEADAPLFLCYNEMLVFKTKLTKDQSRTQRSLKWPFEKYEIKAVIRRLRNLKSLLDTAIASDHLALSIDLRGNVLDIVNSLHVAASKDLIQRLSSWFSAPNPSSNLNTAQTKRQQDTGIWLLKSPNFLSWKAASHSFLWLHGKAGCGKTILSSTVVRSLLDAGKSGGTVAYFYFDFQTHEKQLFQNFLSSIVVQLFSQNPQVTAIVEELYKAYNGGRSRPTIQDTCVVLRRIINKIAASVYMVVDALDECQDRRTLLGGLKDIRSWNQENLHIFVTSRRETEIEDVLCTLTTDTISLEESVVDGDILTYVRYQLQNDVKLSKWSEEIRNEIEIALVNGANGMFRWVVCQLDAIRGSMKLGLLRKALRTLPKTLDETYARILKSIPEEHVEDARRILSCLICAFRPLAIEEIAETVAIVIEGEPYYDMESRLQEPRDVLAICSGLVSSTEFSRSTSPDGEDICFKGLRLAHFSVKEYLTSDRSAPAQGSRFALDERHAHELLAKLCILYLLWWEQEGLRLYPQTWRERHKIFDRPAFALYAASFWSKHLQIARLDHSAPLYSECLKMLTRPLLLRHIIRLHGARYALGEAEELLYHSEILFSLFFVGTKFDVLDVATDAVSVSPLYYVSLLGMDELVLKLLAAGEDINSAGPGGTCLAAATFSGHKTVVRLLLDKGAKVNAVVQQTRSGYEKYSSPTAIQWAAERGHEDIVKILLAEGADVNICRGQPPMKSWGTAIDTPLKAAVEERGAVRTRIVRLLLDAGADINASGHGNSTALMDQPILNDNIQVMTILLDAGADPNGNDELQTPFIHAIEYGQVQCANLLIERGANLESIDSHLISALCRLSWRRESFPSAIELALKVKPNLSTEMLLIAAAKYGHSESVNLLLRNGTSADVQNENGLAALHAAAFTPGDDYETVELLLEANANVNIHGGPFGSALQAAALSGKVKAVLILLQHGALPDYAGGSYNYGPALHIAQKRLEDTQKKTYTKLSPCHFRYYGPDGYFHESSRPWSDGSGAKPVNQVGDDYVPHFDFSPAPNADYQAVIDVLQSHSAS